MGEKGEDQNEKDRGGRCKIGGPTSVSHKTRGPGKMTWKTGGNGEETSKKLAKGTKTGRGHTKRPSVTFRVSAKKHQAQRSHAQNKKPGNQSGPLGG